jgi:hypothetical protein
MIDAALNYAAAGWHVFPLVSGGKAPATQDGFKSATTDEAKIRAWWTENPAYNIGIALDESGLAVVDVDTHGDVNGYDSLHLLDLPETLAANTAGGGRHLIYSNGGNPPPRKVNIVKKLGGKGIDLLANGYIVAAPSVVEGKRYEWDCPKAVAPLPDSIRELAKPEVVNVPPPWEQPARRSEPGDIRERARLYLQNVEPAYQGQGGHNALMWAARCLITGFRLSRTEALGLLWSEYNPRCSPSWDPSSPSEAKDFERKVDQVIRTPSKHADGWLIEETGGYDRPIEKGLLSFFESFADRFGQKPEPAKSASPEDLARLDEAWKNRKAPKVPNLNPGGLVGDVMEYFEDAAIRPQKILSLAGALTMCGVLMGRKVKSAKWSAKTNLYCIGAAPSSWGKDNVLQRIEEIFEAVGCGQLIGGTAATGDSAMEKRMKENPVTLYLWDEVGHTLGGFAAGKKSNDSHAQTAVPFMMKAWSSANRTMRGKDRAGDDNRTAIMNRPCLSLYGTGTPDRIADAIGVDQLNDGWLPRCLYFIAEERGEKRATAYEGGIPESILERCSAWARFSPLVDEGDSILEAEGGAKEVVVPFDADAWLALNRFDGYADELGQLNGSTGVALLWGKATENATRIALIVACGKASHPKDARIRLEDIRFACDLVKYLIENFICFIEGEVAGSEAESAKKKLTKLIKLAGRKGMSQTEITRKTQWISGARERNGYLQDLEEANILIRDVDNSKGRPSVKYIYNPET